jgi:hypothetical protein
MTAAPNSNVSGSTQRSWLETISQHRRPTAYVLFVVSFLFLLIPIVIYLRVNRDTAAPKEEKEGAAPTPTLVRWDYFPVSLWGGTMCLLAFGAGLSLVLRQPSGTTTDEADKTRILVLTIGGLSGLATVLLLGLALPYFQWWDIVSGGLVKWRENWWRLGICVLALFGGLILMFASLQLARGEERSNPALRRLLYGYNAALTGLLLLAILTVVNVLSYVRLPPFSFFNTPSDWTESSIYTLTTASKNILLGLDKPLKIYVLLADPVDFREVQTLLTNCRAVNPKIEVEYISPDDSRRLGELARKYQLVESEGLLLVYGAEPREEHEFVNARDLRSNESAPGRGSRRFLFQGENVLMTKLSFLVQGKSRTTVYFTQGEGELELDNSDMSRPNRGLGVLKERLEKGNFDVKELKISPTTERIPEDAGAVVIARPSRAFPQNALTALHNYLSPSSPAAKKGKLIVLFDVFLDRDGKMAVTGLESLLADYNVQLGNDRVLSLRGGILSQWRYPLEVPVFPVDNSTNAIAASFDPRLGFLFSDCRSVKANPSGAGAASRYNAEVIFRAPRGICWSDTDIKGDIKEQVDAMIKDPEGRRILQQKINEGPVPVAVAVSEPKEAPPSPGDPHAFMRNRDQEPRLVVFGAANWVANQAMSERSNSGNYELLASTLSWLRERPDIGKQADPKERKVFVMSASEEVLGNIWWLPALVILVGIISLGGGIWIVRRR